MRCSFVPPYLLARVAACPDAETAARCHRTLAIDAGFRTAREAALAQAATSAAPAGTRWTVHTADNTAALPGTPVRATGESPSGDPAVDEAWAGLEASLAMFEEVYGWPSYDGRGAPVLATVHYERDYANAFWDGAHLVLGDGDGRVFGRFTRPIDVLAHELAHGVTEHTAGLVYRDQPGALSESMSDVFAACLKQRVLGQAAAEGDWLIGEGLFLPGVHARALRSMSAPGTAYDDPVLGKDPQGGHLDDYIVTSDDNGGVHLNSGIPNRAFHLAALAVGGTAAEGAGRIWWAALQTVRATVDFAGFAEATVSSAGEHAAAVSEAWAAVGVRPGAAGQPTPTGEPSAAAVVEVRRSGGLLGRTVSGRVDLTTGDERAVQVRSILDRVDLRVAHAGRSHPDAYSYVFSVGRESFTLAETELTEDLRLLATLVLPKGP